MRKSLTAFFTLLFFSASPCLFAEPAKKLYVGERLVYSVKYLGLEVGKGVVEVKEITEIRGRKAYHIEIKNVKILGYTLVKGEK